MVERKRDVVCFLDAEFDPAELRIRRDGEWLQLQPKVSRVLEILTRRAGQLVAKDELIGDLWPDDSVNEEALTQLIRRLRRVLRDNPRSPRYIQTVTGRGYRFLPAVTSAPMAADAGVEWAAEPAPPAPSSDPPSAASRPLGSRAWATWRVSLPTTVAALLAGLVLAVVLWARGRETVALRLGECATRRITSSSGHKQDVAFSPDGRHLAFAANDPEEGQYDLFLAAVDGSTTLRLTHTPGDEFYPQYSPDGTTIAYSRIDGTREVSIRAMGPLGGAEHLLVAGAQLASWSADGLELAFARQEPGGSWRIVRRRLLDGRELVVATPPAPVHSLAWSPRGSHLAFTDASSLFVVPAGGGVPERLGRPADYIGGVSWEATGKALLCDANWQLRGNVWRVPLDGGRPEPLTATTGGVHGPVASRDGSRVAFINERKEQELFTVAADGSQPRPLPTKTTLHFIDISPDSRWLAFTDDDPSQPGRGIGLLPLPDGQSRILELASARCPVFSPTGDALALIRREEAGESLLVHDLARGSTATVLQAAGGRLLARPAWAPDGRSLVVATDGGAGPSGLELVEPVTGRHRQLAAGAFEAAAWSHDGRRVAASGTAGGPPGLIVVEVSTGVATRISGHHSFSAAPIWGDDDDHLLVLGQERSHPRLHRIGLDGRDLGDDIVLEFPPVQGFWGIFEVRPRDQGFVYVLERYESDVYVLEPAQMPGRRRAGS